MDINGGESRHLRHVPRCSVGESPWRSGASPISTQLWIYDIDDETLTALTTSSGVSMANFPV